MNFLAVNEDVFTKPPPPETTPNTTPTTPPTTVPFAAKYVMRIRF